MRLRAEMKEPEQATVFWKAVDTSGKEFDGFLEPIIEGSEPKISVVEENLFTKIKDLDNLKALRLAIKWPDGSGYERYYVRRGEIWLKLHSDNYVPKWFGLTFLIGLSTLIVVLVILGIFGIIK